MDLDLVLGLVARVGSLECGTADRAALEAALADIAKSRAWFDGREAAVVAALQRVSSFPEKNVADASRTSLRHGQRVVERANTASEADLFGAALDHGQISGAHVDVLGRVLRGLSPDSRQQLLDRQSSMVHTAQRCTVEEFSRLIRREADQLTTETDREQRFLQQQRQVRLTSWVDPISGMGHWNAQWDPHTMVILDQQLRTASQRLFHDQQPEHCPLDPIDKQHFLNAHALVHLLTTTSTTTGPPEAIVVIHGDNGQAVIDYALPIDLPTRVTEQLLGRADIHTIVVNPNTSTIVSAPGNLNPGPTTRLANKAQRRALNALYPTCALFTNCTVPFHLTHIHHIDPWEHSHNTNLDNLIPVCHQHHQRAHRENWQITMSSGRTITITYPDGTTTTTPPPTRNHHPP